MRRSKDNAADLRTIPCYTIPEAAHYLRVSPSTLRSWVLGQDYVTGGEQRRYKPLLKIAERRPPTLSFLDLVEAHVLKAIRRDHHVPMQKVRRALDWVAKEFGSKRPLLDHQFASDGYNLFLEHYGSLVDLSATPQLAMREVLRLYLTRIERDAAGVPIKLYPFTRRSEQGDPAAVEVDPRVSFGRPVIRGTGIPTHIIAERYKAGDSLAMLAQDYERTEAEIEEAVRCELPLQAA